MANKKHTAQQRTEFSERLNKIYDRIPSGFEKKVLAKLPNAMTATIINVRYGRSVNFQILEALEEITEPVIEKLTK